MATSSRERQRKHRELQRQAGAKRLDYILPLETHEKIKNLALAGNKSKKAVLIELINKATFEHSPSQTAPQEKEQKLAWFEQSSAH